MAAVTAVLAHYPEEVITSVTHPVSGLPSKSNWLPTIKEVTDACNAIIEPIRKQEATLKRIKDQLEILQMDDRGERPTMAQLKERYGDNWGLDVLEKKTGPTFKAPDWGDITKIYSAEPSRLAALLNAKES